ncbi:MAG: O-antigen ligase family protein [Acidobacteriota bacterium]
MEIRKADIRGRFLDYGILALLALSPIPAASVHEWSVLIIEVAVVTLAAVCLLSQGRLQGNAVLSSSLKWPRRLFLGLFLFLAFQIVPLPKTLAHLLSPQSYSYRESFSATFPTENLTTISVIPGQTLRKALELLSYVLLGWLIISTVKTRRQILRIFSVLVVMGTLEAFYGLYELTSASPRILFYPKTHTPEAVTGTFVNRNHFSGYLEMVIPLAIGLAIARLDVFSLAGLKWKERLLRFSEKGLATNILLSLGIILMSLAIIFSQSRSGVTILILTFILFSGLTLLHQPSRRQKKRARAFLAVVFLLVVGISLYVGVRATLERFSLDRILHEQRPVFWGHALRIFIRFPVFGSGLGTLTSLLPDIEQDGSLVRVFHAHNDYLEYLAELGFLGMGLLLAGILFLGIKAFLIWRERRHPEVKGLALGASISIICMLVHSLADFNLQIPANMLLFSTVLALAVVTSFYKKGEVQARENRPNESFG